MRSIGIAGAGTMGKGIAQVALQTGHEVILFDQEPRAAASAPEAIARGLQGAVERGKLAPEAKEQALGRLRIADQLDDLARADLIIEAVAEDLQTKKALFAALDRSCPHSVILASNTSSLSITAIAAATANPARVVGMHFFNPVPAMRLVEIVPGLNTTSEVMQTLTELARTLGKTPVQSMNRPGFIVNRIAGPYYAEALRLVEEGAASAEGVDQLLKAMGFRMGPFELMDLVGLDVCQAISTSMYEATFGEPRFRPHPRLAEMVDAGRLGRKSGKGFYEHGTR